MYMYMYLGLSLTCNFCLPPPSRFVFLAYFLPPSLLLPSPSLPGGWSTWSVQHPPPLSAHSLHSLQWPTGAQPSPSGQSLCTHNQVNTSKQSCYMTLCNSVSHAYAGHGRLYVHVHVHVAAVISRYNIAVTCSAFDLCLGYATNIHVYTCVHVTRCVVHV